MNQWEAEPIAKTAPILCSHDGCLNWALVVFVADDPAGSPCSWCLGHAYLDVCPGGCGARVWNCAITGCGDCQGINEDVNSTLQEMWTMENRAFGFSDRGDGAEGDAED